MGLILVEFNEVIFSTLQIPKLETSLNFPTIWYTVVFEGLLLPQQQKPELSL